MALLPCLVLLPPSRAAAPVSTGAEGLAAIGGKDTFSYHTPQARAEHRVEEGSPRHEVIYLGATWRFASQASAERFAANPAAYAPVYNGFCANALASDEGLIDTRGDVWEFFGDHLYLFYAERGRQRWLHGDWHALKRRADRAWAEIVERR